LSTLKTNTLSNVAGTSSTAIENAIHGSAKAWVNFNGTGTVAIRAQYNVSSITDNGTGDYTVNFTTALADANYAVAKTAGLSGVAIQHGRCIVPFTTAPATGSFRFANKQANIGTNTDDDLVYVAIFR
jgi:hypothetical protein